MLLFLPEALQSIKKFPKIKIKTSAALFEFTLFLCSFAFFCWVPQKKWLLVSPSSYHNHGPHQSTNPPAWEEVAIALGRPTFATAKSRPKQKHGQTGRLSVLTSIKN